MFACPCCGDKFGTVTGAVAIPVLFSPCGHTVCCVCAEAASLAVRDSETAMCCVCDTYIRMSVPNTGVLGPVQFETVAVCGTAPSDGGFCCWSPHVDDEGFIPPPSPSTSVAEPGASVVLSVKCCKHPELDVLFTDAVGATLCEVCARDRDITGWVFPFVGNAEPVLSLLLEDFECAVVRMRRSEAAAVSGIAAVVDAGETAMEQTKAACATLRRMFDAREASLLQEAGAETRRRVKVLEAQAGELATTASQAQAVIRVGRAALVSADPGAIARAHKLAHTSRGLLDPHLALKVSPKLTAQIDVAAIQRILEAGRVGAADDVAHERALACHNFVQHQPCGTVAARPCLFETCTKLMELCSGDVSARATGVAYCRSICVRHARGLTEPGADSGCWCGCVGALQALVRAAPPAELLGGTVSGDPLLHTWCEAWCEALVCITSASTLEVPEAEGLLEAVKGVQFRLLGHAATHGTVLSRWAWLALEVHSDNATKARIVETAIGTFAGDADALCSALVAVEHLLGDMPSSFFVCLTHALVRFPDHVPLQTCVQRLLGRSNPDVLERFLSEGNGWIPVAALSKHPRSNRMRLVAFELLRYITLYHTAEHTGDAQIRVYTEAVKAALAQPSNVDVAVSGACTLAQLARAEMGLAGAMAILDECVEVTIFPLLRSSCRHDVILGLWGSQRVALSARFVSSTAERPDPLGPLRRAVYDALAAHVDSEAVQLAGIRQFCVWATCNGWFEAPDAWAAVCRAMDAFPESVPIQAGGLCMVSRLPQTICGSKGMDRACVLLQHPAIRCPELLWSVADLISRRMLWGMMFGNAPQSQTLLGLFCDAIDATEGIYENHKVLSLVFCAFAAAFSQHNPPLSARMATTTARAIRAHPSVKLPSVDSLLENPLAEMAIAAALAALPP